MQENKSDLVRISSDLEEGRQHNAQSPSSRLPDELLGEIMCIYRDICTDLESKLNPYWRESPSPAFLWVAVAQVCHRWRQTAIGHPVLWSHIILQSTRHQLVNPFRRNMILELLHRSRDCPMTFMGRGMFESIDVAELSLIVANFHRFRYVSMEILPLMILELPPFPPAPHLEVFDFKLQIPAPTPQVFPLLFSNTNSPRIQQIGFRRLPFSNISPFLRSTLTKISVTSCNLNAQDCSVFAYSLQAMSGLRELLLSSVDVPEIDPRIMPRDLKLPTLQVLTVFVDGSSSIMHLVSCISIPHDTHMHFHYRVNPPPRFHSLWAELDQFILGIGNLVTSNMLGGVPTFRTIRLQGSGGYALGVWHEELTEGSRLGVGDDDPDPDLLVRIRGTGLSLSTASLLRRLCGILPLSSVRTGFLVFKAVERSSAWHNILSAVNDSEIRHLQVSTSNAVYFCRALSKWSETRPTLPLPNIDRLVLYEAQFLHSQHPFRSTHFQRIKSWLRLRADRGHKIRRLEFREAVNFWEGDLDVLRDCVDDLIWDNVEKIPDDPPPHHYVFGAPSISLEEEKEDDLEPHLLVDQANAFEGDQ